MASRHRSLRATFERTWQRLTDEEQTVFARLSVFRGGFTLESAEAVAGANIRHLRKLAQKALIQTEANQRCTIHELLRQFGEEKLAQADALSETQAKHAAYFADFMAERELDFNRQLELHALEQIHYEFENIRVAWLYLVNQREWKPLLSFFIGLFFYGDNCVRPRETLDLMEYAQDVLQTESLSELSELTMGHVQLLLSWFYGYFRLNEQSHGALENAVDILRRHNSHKFLGYAYFSLASRARDAGQPEATIQYAQTGEELLTLFDDHPLSVILRWIEAEARIQQGNYEQALQELNDLLPIVGKNIMEIILYRTLGLAYTKLKQYEQAKQWLHKAVATRRQYTIITHPYSISDVYENLGELALAEADFPLAHHYFKRALEFYYGLGYAWMYAFPIGYIAQVYTFQDRLDEAVELLATIIPHLSTYQGREQLAYDLRNQLESQLEPAQFAVAWAKGEARELNVLARELLAELEADWAE